MHHKIRSGHYFSRNAPSRIKLPFKGISDREHRFRRFPRRAKQPTEGRRERL